MGVSSRVRWSVIVIVMATGGCADEPALQRLSEARALGAELLVQFTKAADATNRVVMADTEAASGAFAGEAEQATQAVDRTTSALKEVLASLGYSNELQLLDEFSRRFAEYRALDRRILELAFENTNGKAQRLSFGPGQKAANAFRHSLEAVARAAPSTDNWRTRALVATAVSAVHEIQVLQAAHIPEADDAVMARLEAQMMAAEGEARSALDMLKGVVAREPESQLAATAALDRFLEVNTQILSLSRRNSNVRSLALSLGEKGTLSARCEDGLRALQNALAKRGFSGTR